MFLNLNDRVRVQLNTTGLELLTKAGRLNDVKVGGVHPIHTPMWEGHLWELMNIFGPHMGYPRMDGPFIGGLVQLCS